MLAFDFQSVVLFVEKRQTERNGWLVCPSILSCSGWRSLEVRDARGSTYCIRHRRWAPTDPSHAGLWELTSTKTLQLQELTSYDQRDSKLCLLFEARKVGRGNEELERNYYGPLW